MEHEATVNSRKGIYKRKRKITKERKNCVRDRRRENSILDLLKWDKWVVPKRRWQTTNTRSVKSPNSAGLISGNLKSTLILTMKPAKLTLRKNKGNLNQRLHGPSNEN